MTLKENIQSIIKGIYHCRIDFSNIDFDATHTTPLRPIYSEFYELNDEVTMLCN